MRRHTPNTHSSSAPYEQYKPLLPALHPRTHTPHTCCQKNRCKISRSRRQDSSFQVRTGREGALTAGRPQRALPGVPLSPESEQLPAGGQRGAKGQSRVARSRMSRTAPTEGIVCFVQIGHNNGLRGQRWAHSAITLASRNASSRYRHPGHVSRTQRCGAQEAKQSRANRLHNNCRREIGGLVVAGRDPPGFNSVSQKNARAHPNRPDRETDH